MLSNTLVMVMVMPSILNQGTEFDTAPWYRGQKLSGSWSHFRDVEWLKTTNRFHPDAAKPGNAKRSKKIKVTIEEVNDGAG